MPTKPLTHLARLAESSPWDRQRTPGESLYGTARWKRFRRMFLSRNPLCCDPDARHPGRTVAAVDVDHIIPWREDPQRLTFNALNCQALCKSCHSAKTRHENYRGGG